MKKNMETEIKITYGIRRFERADDEGRNLAYVALIGVDEDEGNRLLHQGIELLLDAQDAGRGTVGAAARRPGTHD